MEQKNHAILCPRCNKLVSRNAEECYNCGLKSPGRVYSSPQFSKILMGHVSYVDGLLYTCVALYVVALLLNPAGIGLTANLFNLLSPDMYTMLKLGMTGYWPLVSGGMAALPWWTNVTAIFLHGSLLHIFFNMMWLRQLGPLVEQLFGSARFFLIFMFSGILGFVVSNLFSHVPTLGASGSIFGLLGAVVYYGKNRGGFFGKELYRQFLQWAVVIFIIGFLMSGVNNFAHGGGFVGGYLGAQILGYQEKNAENYTHRMTALGILIGTVAIFIYNFAHYFLGF